MTKETATAMTKHSRRTHIDFSKLSWGTLRKYQFYFKVKPIGNEELKDKETVVAADERHFEEMKIDTQKLIYKFLKIKKDEKTD